MRRPFEEKLKPPNHERWIVSYADFMTSLLATFVILYAVSTVNHSKFQQMSEALSTAFKGTEISIKDSGLAAAHKAPFDNMPTPIHTPITTRIPQVRHLPSALRRHVERRTEMLNDAYRKLTTLFAGMISKGEVRVSLQALGVVIDINAVVLFDSAQAELSPGAQTLIDQVAGILAPLNYPIQIDGFTDNAPIHTAQFSSNWDLSAARAISVVKRFVLNGIDPSLLVGAGYGEYHPVASNDTPEGRAMNRRVSIVAVAPSQGQDILHTPLASAAAGRSGASGGDPAAASAPGGRAPARIAPPSPDCGGAPSAGGPC
jgi:chemotaxis protein MotB